MSNETLNSINEQIQKLVLAPTQAFVSLSVDHAERLASLQVETANDYLELGFKQLRAALDIKDPQGLQAYVEGSRKVAENLGERVKGDAEKVVSLQREFAERAQKLAQQNVSSFSQAAGQK